MKKKNRNGKVERRGGDGERKGRKNKRKEKWKKEGLSVELYYFIYKYIYKPTAPRILLVEKKYDLIISQSSEGSSVHKGPKSLAE